MLEWARNEAKRVATELGKDKYGGNTSGGGSGGPGDTSGMSERKLKAKRRRAEYGAARRENRKVRDFIKNNG